MKKISIVGYGRFGKILHLLLKDSFDVTIYTRPSSRHPELVSGSSQETKKMLKQVQHDNNVTSDLEKVYENDVIFYAVPIASFEEVIREHKQYFEPRHLLIDVLSVKMHPAKIFEQYLKGTKTQALLTHPMFGPDSSKDGFGNLPMIMDQFMADKENYLFWKKYFESKKLRVIEMPAEKHDKIAADSQGLTHFIGRLLAEMKMRETAIDTLGAKKLQEIEEQVCNDSWQLFTDLQHFNPYTKKMRLKLGEAYDKLYNKLLPKQLNPDYITYGIQGGPGSFNEEALQYHLTRNNITKYKVVYLHTSDKVLEALHEGSIDQGQFAIHNSIGGIVEESIQAMAKYKFTIIEEFAIKIAHTLMIRKDANLKDITTIMTHPQVLAQCRNTLSQKYPNLIQTFGVGELIDHALVAKQLSEGKLPKNIATMGSKILAEIYDLHIVETDLQDLKENYTSFLLVER